MSREPITPHFGSGVSLSVTSTSSNSAITMNEASRVAVTNLGTNKCYVVFGYGSAPTADSADYCVPANSVQVLSVGNATHVAAICDSTETCTLKVIPVDGV